MKKMFIVCLVVFSLVGIACSPPQPPDSGSSSVPDAPATVAESSPAEQVSDGVSEADTLTTELDSSDADKAAGELEKLSW